VRFLFRFAATEGVSSEAFASELRSLVPGLALAPLLVPLYERALPSLRQEIATASLAAHGKVLAGVEWRIDAVVRSCATCAITCSRPTNPAPANDRNQNNTRGALPRCSGAGPSGIVAPLHRRAIVAPRAELKVRERVWPRGVGVAGDLEAKVSLTPGRAGHDDGLRGGGRQRHGGARQGEIEGHGVAQE